jgi:hypothetical protein
MICFRVDGGSGSALDMLRLESDDRRQKYMEDVGLMVGLGKQERSDGYSNVGRSAPIRYSQDVRLCRQLIDTTTKSRQYPSYTRYVFDACLTVVETAGVEGTGPW